jgi:pimeloyl-ACP methyl ester carboxylesterase
MNRTAGVSGVGATCAVVFGAASFVVACGSESAPGASEDSGCDRTRTPIVFVHGGLGSGDQFQSQALRFKSNGYCEGSVAAFSYDSVVAAGANGVTEVEYEQLDAVIDRIRSDNDAAKVELVGHSLGTAVSRGYLESNAGRAARVAHYVNVEGRGGPQPAGVSTLSLIGDAGHGQEVDDGKNVVLGPGVDHVFAATAESAFVEMYRFFNGAEPETAEVVPSSTETVKLSGQVVDTGTNKPPAQGSAQLSVFVVDQVTGMRDGETPVVTFDLGTDGHFGPFDANRDTYYEFELKDLTAGNAAHYYYEPFLRSDQLIFVKRSGALTRLLNGFGPSGAFTRLSVIRNKAYWGDQPKNDSVKVDGQELSTGVACAKSKDTIALVLGDMGNDAKSDLTVPLEGLASIPFVKGLDFHVPAPTPLRTLGVVVKDRDSGAVHALNMPAWPWDGGSTVSVQISGHD